MKSMDYTNKESYDDKVRYMLITMIIIIIWKLRNIF